MWLNRAHAEVLSKHHLPIPSNQTTPSSMVTVSHLTRKQPPEWPLLAQPELYGLLGRPILYFDHHPWVHNKDRELRVRTQMQEIEIRKQLLWVEHSTLHYLKYSPRTWESKVRSLLFILGLRYYLIMVWCNHLVSHSFVESLGLEVEIRFRIVCCYPC